ncbi:glycosyltransferase [Candidatus Daviesbacteria bacterium]|nr:glycosyltransferase [Candidatus Daviesbacteria bacterium]
MKVAIVHDDLVQWGGAERILRGICDIFPNAPIFTSLVDFSNDRLKQAFAGKKVISSFLQKIPVSKSLYKALLPLYPLSFEQFVFDEYDLVISQTTRFAKCIITKPKTTHISYCHTPPRFLWNYSNLAEVLQNRFLINKLRLVDQIYAQRVDQFLAGSINAQTRIKQAYNRQAPVIYPYVDLQRFNNIESFNGGYFLVIARLNRYKRVDLAIKACFELKLPLKIVGIGPELDRLSAMGQTGEVDFLGNIDDATLTLVLAGAEALIIPGIEDFGLTSLEAQALGKPVIAFKSGGALETVVEGQTGIFFHMQTVDSLKEAIKKLESAQINPERCQQNANKFNKESFTKNFKQIIASLVYTKK